MFRIISRLLRPRSAKVPGGVGGYWDKLGQADPASRRPVGGNTVTAHTARELSRILADPGLRSGSVVIVTVDIYI